MLNFKKAKLINKSFLFITFLFAVTITLLIAYTQKYASFWADDIEYSIYRHSEKLFDCLFSQIHGGYYIGYFLSKFLSFKLPLLFGIHPSDFICSGFGIIKGILTAITIFAISNIVRLFNKKRFTYMLIFILTCLYFCNSVFSSNTLVPYISYNFFRYFFSFLFLSIFMLITYRQIINPNKNTTTKKEIAIASICGFILGTSIEISFFTLITMFFLMMIYNFVFNLNKKHPLKFNSSFYIPNIFLILGTILFTSTSGFHEVASDRGMSSININIDVLKDFTDQFIKYCFFDEIWYWLVFAILICTSFILAKKRKELYKINTILIYTISLFIVMFSLVLCGKTCNMTYSNHDLTFFVSHINILFLYKMLLLVPIIMLVGYISKFLTIKKQLCLFLLFLVPTLSYHCFSSKEIHKYWQEKISFFTIKQREIYIVEKMTRFYLLQNKQPELYVLSDQFFSYDANNICMNGQTTYANYYATLHNDQSILEKGYCRSDNGLYKFYSEGGVISNEELKHLRFKNLQNNDFVLNNSTQNSYILNPQEVIEQLTLE